MSFRQWTIPTGINITIDEISYPLIMNMTMQLNDDFIQWLIIVPIPENYPDTTFHKELKDGRMRPTRGWAKAELIQVADHIDLEHFYVNSADVYLHPLPAERAKGLGHKMLCTAINMMMKKKFYPVNESTPIYLSASGPQCSPENKLDYRLLSIEHMISYLYDFGYDWYDRLSQQWYREVLNTFGLGRSTLKNWIDGFATNVPDILLDIYERYGNLSYGPLKEIFEDPERVKILLVQWYDIYPEEIIREAVQHDYCLTMDNMKLVRHYERYGFKAIDDADQLISDKEIRYPQHVRMKSTIGNIMHKCNGLMGRRSRKSNRRISKRRI